MKLLATVSGFVVALNFSAVWYHATMNVTDGRVPSFGLVMGLAFAGLVYGVLGVLERRDNP